MIAALDRLALLVVRERGVCQGIAPPRQEPSGEASRLLLALCREGSWSYILDGPTAGGSSPGVVSPLAAMRDVSRVLRLAVPYRSVQATPPTVKRKRLWLACAATSSKRARDEFRLDRRNINAVRRRSGKTFTRIKLEKFFEPERPALPLGRFACLIERVEAITQRRLAAVHDAPDFIVRPHAPGRQGLNRLTA